MKFAVAHTDDPISEDAVALLLAEAESQLAGREPEAGLLFAGIHHEHQVLVDGIMARYPRLRLVGCTTDGEFSMIGKYTQDSVGLCLLAADEGVIQAGLAENISADPVQAGATAIAMARAGRTDQPAFALAFPESLTSSAGLVLGGLQKALGNSVPIFGGSSADQLLFKSTYQFYGNRVLKDSVVVLLFFGPFRFASGVGSGVKPIGIDGVLTRSEGTVLYEIDNRPALEFYHNQVGPDETWEEMIANVVAFPLAVKNGSSWYLRNVRQFDRERGALLCFSEVPVGSVIRIGHSHRQEIISATREAVRAALVGFGSENPPSGALFFSCASRRMTLGTMAREEIVIGSQTLGNIPSLGFYTYGEICPMEGTAVSLYHNATFVCLLLGEEPSAKDLKT